MCLHSEAWATPYSVPDPFEYELLNNPTTPLDTIPADTLKDRSGNWVDDPNSNPFDFQDPGTVEKTIEYDPNTGMYMITEKVGDDFYRAPTYMTFEEYMDWSAKQDQDDYWKQLAGVTQAGRSASGRVDPISTVDISKDIIDRLFGGSEIDIRPQGNIEMTFGWDYQRQDNPVLPIRQQRTGGFDFDMDIQVNVDGKIGKKLDVGFNYNTRATFDFENQLKLNYNSQEFGEDDILQKIEAGNVSLPLRGTLIQGVQNLFGVKTELQFGHLRLTAIASQQRSEKNDIVVQGGSVLQEFSEQADSYVQDRAFFMSHFNRETFEGALGNLPQINSLFRINRLEVWITNNKSQTVNVRDIVAIADIGEARRIKPGNEDFISEQDTMELKDICDEHVLPTNDVNTILRQLQSDPSNRYVENAVTVLNDLGLEGTEDYEKLRARKLTPTEFNYHPDLGFITLNINVNPDQVLGVAYEYTYNGQTFQVGELSDQIPVDPDKQSVIYVKMLKSTVARVDLPIWDLMMKNFYRVGGGDLNPEDFELDVFYEDPGAGFKRFLPEETGIFTLPLLNIFNLDNLNATGDPQPDGRFDFVEGLTIFPRAGYMMFPVLEPFGSSLDRIMKAEGTPEEIRDQYTFPELYDSTHFRALEFPEKNRFTIRGESKSTSSSDISLGAFNIPPGSVRVTAGGQTLEENVDYVIDYNIGRLKILNEAYIQPGTPIRVSFEDNALFSFQKKTMLGLRADYEVSDKLFIGGTYMRLFERPYTQKVNIGDDPINNRVFGLDMTYSDEAPWLTKLVDKIPGLSTKEKSNINFQAEFASLSPGHSKAITGNDGDNGVVYIDDFEGTASKFDLRTPENRWQLSSIPQHAVIEGQDYFPESELKDDLQSGVNRALLNWYRIDQSVRSSADQNNPYTRAVDIQEIFRGRTRRFGNNDFRTFDMTFYPDERGPYNFDLPDGGTTYSEGLDNQCNLIRPDLRWGGIQRDLQNTNFEQANFEFLEFWMLDPYILDTIGNTELSEGYLVFNLGNVSEDVLKDGRLFFEHGVPIDDREAPMDTTNWGRIPKLQPVVNAFANDIDARIAQDIGHDGWDDPGELAFYSDYVNAINQSSLPLDCKSEILSDVSNDNFYYYDDPMYTNQDNIFTRYKKFNGTQNNSPPTPRQGRVSANTNRPNNEDLNGDLSLTEDEQYYQYIIKMIRTPDGPVFIPLGDDDNGNRELRWEKDTITGQTGTWYRFKIPLDQGVPVNGIQGFRSIRFMRMYMTGFDQHTTLRFATLDLVRSQWRRYTQTECFGDASQSFEIDVVNIEENSAKTPFPYVVPEGIQRERIVASTFQDVFQNEQSLSMQFCGLQDECDVRVFKLLDLDMRVFERMQMFVHAESDDLDLNPIEYGDLELFVRLGSDFENNFYEYRIPLMPSTDPEAADIAQEVWKQDTNNVNFRFKELTDLKIERNSNAFPLDEVYFKEVDTDPDKPYRLSIRGNPTLGYVKNIMVGVRNAEGGNGNICGEVWINELRVSGLDERGGVAALARLDMDLADWGTLGIASSYSSIGYGAIDQKVSERQRESILQFDISTGLELGKFFGREAGVSIPFYAQYSTTKRRPEFDPIDLDLLLKDKLNRAPDKETRDSVKEQAEDVNSLSLISFTNIRKQQNPERKAKPWSISNFSASYIYSTTKARNEVLEKDDTKQHKAQLDYSYSIPDATIQPFKSVSQSKWLAWFTELNLNPLPSSFSFSTVLQRRFGQRDYRFSDPVFKTWFNKRFTWDRTYALRWNLTKSISFDFNAVNVSVVDEPDEYIDRTTGERITTKERRDSIFKNMANFGRTKEYSHNFRLAYRIPTNLFPFLDWIRADASYNGQYSWSAAALNTDSLGNVIQNGQGIQFTADFDLTRLYNKSDYLSRINSGRSGGGRSKSSLPSRTGGRTQSDQNPDDPDQKDGKGKAKKEKKDRNGEPSTVARVGVRFLMMFRKFRLSYSVDRGTVLPGFTPKAGLLGMENFTAPGWDFISGIQPNIGRFENSSGDWLDEIGTVQDDQGNIIGGNQWVTDNVFQSQPLTQTETKILDTRLTIEPFKDFRIEVDAKRSLSYNFSMFYKNTDKNNVLFERLTPREVGSFSMTYFSAQTLFKGGLEGINEQFRIYENNRYGISEDRGEPGTEHALDSGYTEGFGRTQQDVLVPAFIAAYTNKDPENFELTDIFDWIPRPNWTLTYNGLNKFGIFQEWFSSVRISHGYKSTLTINQFQSNLQYTPPQIQDENLNPATFNYFSQYIIPAIVIDEEFSPLVGIDLRTKNEMGFRFNYVKRRNLRFGFTSNELAETRATTVDFGFSWTLRNIELKWLPGYKSAADQNSQILPGSGRGASAVRTNDLEFLFDFSFSDNITVNHYLDQQALPQPTRGSEDIRVSPSIRYGLNRFINLRLFVDYRRTVPYVTTGFPITSIEGGLVVQVVLQ